MFLDRLNYFSEKGLEPDPEYPEVERITLYDLAEMNLCPACGQKLTPRDKEMQPRTIRDYDITRRKVVLLTVYRKTYRCTKCRQSFTADDWMNDIKYTAEFERFLALEALRESALGTKMNKKYGRCLWNNETFAKRYGYHRDTISNIAKNYAPSLIPLFLPPTGYDVFCLFPFYYDFKKRYYLLAGKNENNSMILAVLGHHDAFTELKTYLMLHSGLFKGMENSTIYTDFDAELIELLNEFFTNVKLADELFTNKLNTIKERLKNQSVNEVTKRKIDFPFITLLNALTCKKEIPEEKDLAEWWLNILSLDGSKGTEFSHYLSEFKDTIYRYRNEILELFSNSRHSMNEIFTNKDRIDEKIKDCARYRTDFCVLVAKIMLHSEEQMLDLYGRLYVYTSLIFTDAESRDFYSQKECCPDEVLEAHCFRELLEEHFNRSDLSDMILDTFWMQNEDTLKEPYTDITNTE